MALIAFVFALITVACGVSNVAYFQNDNNNSGIPGIFSTESNHKIVQRFREFMEN